MIYGSIDKVARVRVCDVVGSGSHAKVVCLVKHDNKVIYLLVSYETTIALFDPFQRHLELDRLYKCSSATWRHLRLFADQYMQEYSTGPAIIEGIKSGKIPVSDLNHFI